MMYYIFRFFSCAIYYCWIKCYSTFQNQIPMIAFSVFHSYTKCNLWNLHSLKSLGNEVVVDRSALRICCFLRPCTIKASWGRGAEADGSCFCCFVHSSEGVPGGLSAAGRRRRMDGCGAPSSSVSRLSPSTPQIFLLKRLKRYSAASPLTHSLFCAEPSYMHVTQTCTAREINSSHCESETPGSRSSCLAIDPSGKLKTGLL